MKILSYSFQFLMLLVIVSGCRQKENNSSAQTKVNIHLPTKSANVVFHIKDNKVTSYEIFNEDGSAIVDQLVYRRVSETGEEKCYRCPAGQTDTKKCTEITCPKDPCKEIHCGPLNFGIFDAGSTSPDNETMYTIVADGVKQ